MSSSVHASLRDRFKFLNTIAELSDIGWRNQDNVKRVLSGRVAAPDMDAIDLGRADSSFPINPR
jgi:hypothetical protein